MPYKVSNQIPTDSKTGCTEMFFGNWADLMIGDQMGLETTLPLANGRTVTVSNSALFIAVLLLR